MASSESTSPTLPGEGSAFPWILDHIMKYPGSYEIPLRTMYELNAMPKPQPVTSPNSQPGLETEQRPTRNAFPSPSTTKHRHGNAQKAADFRDTAAMFKANLMSEIAQRPCQPCSLPPSFITSFVQRCFPAKLELVEFEQAMTALDYLKDLERTRKNNYNAALEKLGISEHDDDNGELAKRYPGVAQWLATMKKKNRFALALYTQVYLRIRHWTLMNEMMLRPFNRANCTAMLNTLFPPVTSTPPTPHLNDKTLKDHRALFLKLIREFGQKGPVALDPMIKRDMRPGGYTGWPAASAHIDNYLATANEMIDKCFDVNGRRYSGHATYSTSRKGRHVDSGVSFGSADRPATSSTNGSGKALPPSPVDKPASASGGSTLERIAKEIRKIKSRPDLPENDEPKEPTASREPKGLKKVRSARFLRSKSKKSDEEESDSAFDVDYFRQKKMEWESDHAKRSSA